MATNTTTTLSAQYQSYFSKQLLSYAIQLLRLNEFAQKAELPKNAGAKTVTFFTPGAGASSNVQTLTEGTTPATTRSITLSSQEATLVQYGEVAVLTDILTMTELFKSLDIAVKTMGEDAALQADDISRDELVSNGTKRYAQGAANWATLAAAAAASAKFIATDVLDVVTRLKINRAKPFPDGYVCVLPPQVSRDVMNDDDWKEAALYAGSTQLFKGELGKLHGCRFVEATNPFIESSAGSEGTHVAGGDIFSSIFLGKEAFGVVALSGDRPMSPKVMITKGADKSDPLDQLTKAGWKAYYCAKSLNTNWYRVYKAKSGMPAGA